MESEFRFPPTRPRAATPAGVWFDNDTPSGARADQKADTSPARTRLVKGRARRADDLKVVQLIEGLPPARTLALPAYAVAVLNEAGEVYREVCLRGMGEALVFTARMNASGFGQVPSPDPAGNYDTVFTRL